MNIQGLLEMQGMLMLLLALGALLTKVNIIDKSGKKLLTDLVIYVTLPASILKSFMMEFNMDIMKSCLTIFIIAILIQIGSMLLGNAIFPGYEEKRKKVLQYATICSNAGILGNPIAESAFGSIGLLYASFYLIPQRTFMWSAGLTYFTKAPSKKQLLKRVITHPCIVAVFVGIVMMVTSIALPGVLTETIYTVANANTAMSMILIGNILAGISFKSIVTKDTLYYSFIRLVVIPAIVYAGCTLFHIDELVTGVAVLLSAMPAASVTAVMATKYGKDEIFATKLVVLSTLLSILTAPMWCLLFT
ncbi:MAG: AEC family transporter [Lachnospiraceae bacterium]